MTPRIHSRTHRPHGVSTQSFFHLTFKTPSAMRSLSRCLPCTPSPQPPEASKPEASNTEAACPGTEMPSGEPTSGQPLDTGPAPSPTRSNFAVAAGFMSGVVATGLVGAVVWGLTQPAAPVPSPTAGPWPEQPVDDDAHTAAPWYSSPGAAQLIHLVNEAASRCIDLMFPGHAIADPFRLAEDAATPAAVAVVQELHQQGVNMTRLLGPLDCCPSSLLPGETPTELAARASLGIADHLRGMASRWPHGPAAVPHGIGPVPVPAAVGSASTWADAIGIMALTAGLHTLGLF